MVSVSKFWALGRRFLRFRLRALFCVVTIAAIAAHCGAVVYRRLAAEREIYAHGGRVYFDWQMDEYGKLTNVFRECKGWYRISRQLSLYRVRYISGGPTFDDGALAQLRAFPELEYLSAGYTLITDQGLEALARSGRMHEIKSLDLSYTKVTDRGLPHLAGFPALTRLGLDGTTITDAGVTTLGQLKNLRSLNVDETSVTASGIQAIQRANPRIRISHIGGVVERWPFSGRSNSLRTNKTPSQSLLRWLWTRGRGKEDGSRFSRNSCIVWTFGARRYRCGD